MNYHLNSVSSLKLARGVTNENNRYSLPLKEFNMDEFVASMNDNKNPNIHLDSADELLVLSEDISPN